MSVNSREDFVQWLKSGERLALSVLQCSGMSPELVDRLRVGPRPFELWSGDHVKDRDTGASVTLNDESSAAIAMLALVDLLCDPKHEPSFADGIRLVDLRDDMLRAHWQAEDERSTQVERAKRPRAKKIPRRFVNAWRDAYADWKSALGALPKRENCDVEIAGFIVQFMRDDALLITDPRTGRTSRAIQLETLRDYFNEKPTLTG